MAKYLKFNWIDDNKEANYKLNIQEEGMTPKPRNYLHLLLY